MTHAAPAVPLPRGVAHANQKEDGNGDDHDDGNFFPTQIGHELRSSVNDTPYAQRGPRRQLLAILRCRALASCRASRRRHMAQIAMTTTRMAADSPAMATSTPLPMIQSGIHTGTSSALHL